jgi:uncharacterized RDD family membrane protein YckC
MREVDRKLDTLQTIELAEGMEIRLRIAGPFLRVLAWLLDFFFLVAAIVVISIVTAISGIVIGGNVVRGLLMLAWFVLSWWYPVFFEASKWGATFGKKICGLRVMQPSGAPISFSQAVVRNFLRVVDINPPFFGLIGMVSCLATRRFQRLGDLAAGTVVVYDRQDLMPASQGPPPLSPVRPSVAIKPEEARALATFRDRSVFWSDARRVEIADHLEVLSGTRGMPGVNRLLAMAHWLQERR